MENKDYFLPYRNPNFYGYTREASHRSWLEVWKYIDKLDLEPLIERFADEDIYNLMDYLEKEYPYSNEVFSSLFDGISEYDFSQFLEVKFKDKVMISEVTTQIIRYRRDN